MSLRHDVANLPGTVRRQLRRTASVALVLAMGTALLASLSGQAQADAAAAAVIRGWSDQLVPERRCKPAVLTATQGGSSSGHRPGALYAEANLTRNADGSVTTGAVDVIFSGRTAPGGRQPFDVAQADVSRFTFTLDGNLIEQSLTWGFTQTIPLHAIGNGMLAGWGASIGNAGVPSYWVVGVSPGLCVIPG